ncbi:bone morphogenetic protein receptor type-2-like isoform X2 [Lethenteron reissneri]|uniref:bone morphogenetic protein receptor type-2-like isoform X2 n=1 Tax=Lethenteron reissneri TaxID=7753 RepID=UPI002AB66771|nr:bone morphogenetic protein receptor type-2-like isoform X2 [Lethenteron reissneri]
MSSRVWLHRLLAAALLGAVGASGRVRCYSTLLPSTAGEAPNVTLCDEKDACFAYYKNTSQGLRASTQGCFMKSSNGCDSKTCSVDFTLFCCCSEDLCNVATATLAPTEVTPAPVAPGGHAMVVVLVSLTAAATLLAALLYALRQGHKQWKRKRGRAAEAQPYPSIDTNKLMLIEQIGRGRYGAVWKGVLDECTVAVKVTSLENRQNFLNEREIYRLPLVAHGNITRFIAAEERSGPDGRPEFLVVMEYYQHGSLSNFLMNNASEWECSCRLAHSLTRGLSYLHSEIVKNGDYDQYKPAIAHRDLNSRNVLVRADHSCVLSDLGLAMKLTRRSPVQRGGDDDTSTICEVGTFRYMAPEVLDGAIDLTDYETALKQVDVYSLGLVYWEIFMRCRNLFPEGRAPPYEMALQAELGNHPSFEDVQHFVARERQRPRFPDAWRDDSFMISCLKAVIEECWEHDADARLTANCAEERLAELQSLRSPGPAAPTDTTTAAPTMETNNKINSLRGQCDGPRSPDGVYIEEPRGDPNGRVKCPGPRGSACDRGSVGESGGEGTADVAVSSRTEAERGSSPVPPANGTPADRDPAASVTLLGGDDAVKSGRAGDAIYTREGGENFGEGRGGGLLGSSGKSFHEMGLLNGNQNTYAVY